MILWFNCCCCWSRRASSATVATIEPPSLVVVVVVRLCCGLTVVVCEVRKVPKRRRCEHYGCYYFNPFRKTIRWSTGNHREKRIRNVFSPIRLHVGSHLIRRTSCGRGVSTRRWTAGLRMSIWKHFWTITTLVEWYGWRLHVWSIPRPRRPTQSGQFVWSGGRRGVNLFIHLHTKQLGHTETRVPLLPGRESCLIYHLVNHEWARS